MNELSSLDTMTSEISSHNKLGEGLLNINFVSQMFNSDEELTSHLISKIDESLFEQQYEITQIKDTVQPTYYLHHPRKLRSFEVKEPSGKTTVYVFDIEGKVP